MALEAVARRAAGTREARPARSRAAEREARHLARSSHAARCAVGTTVPLAATINFRAGQTRSNNGTVRPDPFGGVAVFCGMASGSVDVILDVSGYYK